MSEEEMNERIMHLNRLLRASQKRQDELEVQKARYGIDTKPEILTEMGDIEDQINGYKHKIDQLESSIALLRSRRTTNYTNITIQRQPSNHVTSIILGIGIFIILSIFILFTPLNRNDTQAIITNQPISDSSVITSNSGKNIKSVRIGVADGRRLRIVVDLSPNANNNLDKLTKILSPTPSDKTFQIFIPVKSENLPTMRYESSSVKDLANISIISIDDGIKLLISPKISFYTSNVFLLYHNPENKDDRLVIDLCHAQVCPVFN